MLFVLALKPSIADCFRLYTTLHRLINLYRTHPSLLVDLDQPEIGQLSLIPESLDSTTERLDRECNKHQEE